MKICSTCKVHKDRNDFYASRSAKDGLQYVCKRCQKLHRAIHREDYRAYSRDAYRTSPEKDRLRVKAWAESNYKRIRDRARERYAADTVKYRGIIKLWRENNPEKVSASSKKWRDANPEKIRARDRAWQASHPEARAVQAHTRRARKCGAFVETVSPSVVYERDKGVCGICRQQVLADHADIRFRPSIDHIIPLAKGGEHSYANTQLAHRRCNSSKGAKLLSVPQQES